MRFCYLKKKTFYREKIPATTTFFTICQKMKFGGPLAAHCHLICINKSQHLVIEIKSVIMLSYCFGQRITAVKCEKSADS
ncbi:hypothetical protein NEOC65_002092 [Neochlamydia sp. AcF65]|nr:hypothetical protein [Neochlamydia sp. AcF65]MBS4170407.1 hypothetical protein [Neochlamydia sp. AcF95]NGY95379.1 hypothetical protein [Neochlamydia sp. AcF84]